MAWFFPFRFNHCRRPLPGPQPEAAADFSFIIAVPVMIVACFYDLLKSLSDLSGNDLVMIIIGFITAFIVAYISVLWFLKFMNKSTLASFAYYRFVVRRLFPSSTSSSCNL